MLKVVAKTLGKGVKYAQGQIIQRKTSGKDSMGVNFQRWDYCPEGNYLGVIARVNCLVGNFIVGNCLRGSCPGGNYLGVIAGGQKSGG